MEWAFRPAESQLSRGSRSLLDACRPDFQPYFSEEQAQDGYSLAAWRPEDAVADRVGSAWLLPEIYMAAPSERDYLSRASGELTPLTASSCLVRCDR